MFYENGNFFFECLNFLIREEVEISGLSAMPEIHTFVAKDTVSDNKPVCPQNFKYSTLICNFLGHLQVEIGFSIVINMQVHISI